MNPVVHIVGLPVRVGTLERQRCAWCGEIIEDEDLASIATTDPNGVASMSWPVGALLEVHRTKDGRFRGATVLPPAEELPPNCCAKQKTPPKLTLVGRETR